jgi:hypothetical protein
MVMEEREKVVAVSVDKYLPCLPRGKVKTISNEVMQW